MVENTRRRNAVLGRLALLGTTLIWGTSFVVLKSALDSVPVFYLLAIRFTIATALMALFSIPLFKTLDKKYITGGVIMGLFLFSGYAFQTYGLVFTTPGKNAFLTTTYCVLVPFLYWIIHKVRPDRYNIMAAALCIVGVGLVSLQENLSMGVGDMLTLCSGLFFALHILATSRYAIEKSAVLINAIQFSVVALLSWVCALFTEEFPRAVPTNAVIGIIYLSVMCTAVCFFLQTFGQMHTHPSTVAVILTLESVFGAALSVIVYKEQLTIKELSGFFLIFAAVLISETKLKFLSGLFSGRKKKEDFDPAEYEALMEFAEETELPVPDDANSGDSPQE